MRLDAFARRFADAGYAAGDRESTEFERWLNHYEVRRTSGSPAQLRYPINSDPNPVLWVDRNKCILCKRCVRSCAEVQGRFVWGVGERGHRVRIIAGADTGLLQARCESCGTCVAYCPTGALDDRMSIGLAIDLFFPCKGSVDVPGIFKINQPGYPVFPGELASQSLLMFENPSSQIIRHSCV